MRGGAQPYQTEHINRFGHSALNFSRTPVTPDLLTLSFYQARCSLQADLVGLLMTTHEREHRALRILPLGNPAAARYLHRTVDYCPPTGFDTLDGGFDGIDVEVEVPA
jgi:hypothetical protein